MKVTRKRLGIFTLLIFSGLCVYPGLIYLEWAQEQTLVAELKKLEDRSNWKRASGFVEIPKKYQHLRTWIDQHPSLSSKLHKYLERHNTFHVVDIELSDTLVKEICKMRELEGLSLSNVSLPDTSLRHVAKIRHLKFLDLRGNNLESTSMSHLGTLANLEVLHLNNNNLDDNGLEALADLTSLKKLYISGNKITGSGVIHLSPLQHLDLLDCSRNPFNDIGMESFASTKEGEIAPTENIFPMLTYLKLHSTEITDMTPSK